MKLDTYNCRKTTHHAKRYFDRTTSVVWANSQFDTVWFLFLSFFGFFVTRTGRTGGPILTIYTSYDVFSHKDVPFGGSDDKPPHLWGQIPQNRNFWCVNRHEVFKVSRYRNHCVDSNQILQTSKDQQICFVGGPETWQTNPRWRTAAIFKNPRIIGNL